MKKMPSLSQGHLRIVLFAGLVFRNSLTRAAFIQKGAGQFVGMSEVLFVAQAFHGIKLGGAAGRKRAEDNSNQRRYDDRNDGREARDRNAVFGKKADGEGDSESDKNADQAADERNQNGLGKKLKADFTVGSADRLTNSNLTNTLAHGGQHDVHDSDAAYQQ